MTRSARFPGDSLGCGLDRVQSPFREEGSVQWLCVVGPLLLQDACVVPRMGSVRKAAVSIRVRVCVRTEAFVSLGRMRRGAARSVSPESAPPRAPASHGRTSPGPPILPAPGLLTAVILAIPTGNLSLWF